MYRKQLLVGFQGAENALVHLRTRADEPAAQAARCRAAQRSLDLSQQQYQKGATNFLDVLDAERTLRQGQRTETQLLGQTLQVTIQLIKALGEIGDESLQAENLSSRAKRGTSQASLGATRRNGLRKTLATSFAALRRLRMTESPNDA